MLALASAESLSPPFLQTALEVVSRASSSSEVLSLNLTNLIILQEKQTQETWKLFGKSSQPSRPTISNLWEQQSSASSSRSSPWSPQSSSSASSPTWDKQNP